MQKYLYKSPWFPSKPIAVYCYLPASFSPSTQQVVVMHGIDRNAYSYGLAWTPFASANGWMVIAPEFIAADWTSDAYGLGNMFTGSSGSGSLNSKEKWTFSLVSDIQRTLVRGFGIRDTMYTLWGHSAGGQFVHRMMLFAYDPMIRRAIAANPGWYTAPDSTIVYPWGVKHPFLAITRQDLLAYVARDLIIMRGTGDTLRDSDLNVEALSDAQGLNRYQRAGYFFQKGNNVSPSCRWLLLDVVGSGHEYQKMAAAAGAYLQGMTPVKEDAKADAVPQHMGSYPNPFNASTNIVFTVTKSARTTVAVYNILGEKILTLVDDVLSPGVYRRKFDGDAFGNGMYFCRIQSGQESSVIKLLLLK
jgi:Secretion system C-terminal sorting domain